MQVQVQVQLFTFSILLSTAATLLPSVFCSAADLRLQWETPFRMRSCLALTIAIVALAFSIGTLVGTRIESLVWRTILMLACLPVYWRQRGLRRMSSIDAAL